MGYHFLIAFLYELGNLSSFFAYENKFISLTVVPSLDPRFVCDRGFLIGFALHAIEVKDLGSSESVDNH